MVPESFSVSQTASCKKICLIHLRTMATTNQTQAAMLSHEDLKIHTIYHLYTTTNLQYNRSLNLQFALLILNYCSRPKSFTLALAKASTRPLVNFYLRHTYSTQNTLPVITHQSWVQAQIKHTKYNGTFFNTIPGNRSTNVARMVKKILTAKILTKINNHTYKYRYVSYLNTQEQKQKRAQFDGLCAFMYKLKLSSMASI